MIVGANTTQFTRSAVSAMRIAKV